ncbi:hypothetical protein Bca101_061032 [Brassica carinata]
MWASLRCLGRRREQGVCGDRPPMAVSIAGSFSLPSQPTFILDGRVQLQRIEHAQVNRYITANLRPST